MAKAQNTLAKTDTQVRPANTGKPTQRKTSNTSASGILFTKENHKWMIIAGAVTVVGFLLMMGGASKDPNQFNTGEVYSFLRTTIAPILILAGLAIFVFAIMKNPDEVNSMKELLDEQKHTVADRAATLK